MARRPRRPRATPPAPRPPASPSELDRWRQRAVRARKLREHWERTYDVEKAERYFLGDHEERRIRLNHFGATLQGMLAGLMFQAPKFYIRPRPRRTAITEERVAAIAEGALDAIARQDEHLERAGRLAVLQAFFRVGVLKVIYDPRLEPNPKAGQPLYLQQPTGEPLLDPAGSPRPLRDPLTGAALTEPPEVLTDEVYRWAWVDAANLLLPDEGPDPDQWTWLGEEVIVPLAVAQADSRFPEGLRAKLVANYRPTERPGGRPVPTWATGESADEFVKYVECYELRAKRWYVWADGQSFDEFLVADPIPAWIDNDPYALLALGKPVTGPEPMPWPVPLVRDWLGPQDEYNIRRRQIMEGAKRSARKGFYTDGMFDDADEALKALQSPEDMQFAKVTDIRSVPALMDAQDLNPAIYKDIPLLHLDWRLITGQGGARLGQPEADSATEATLVERSANVRETFLQALVSRWLATAGAKMLQCLRETLTLDLWIKLRGMDDQEFKFYVERTYGVPVEQQALMVRFLPGLKEAFRERFGQEKWLRITREQLQFEAEVSIAPGSTRPRNLDVERTTWLQFLRIMGQFPQLALSRELLRETAAKFEYISERMLDELTALAERMVQIQAKVAGRDQGQNGQGGESGVATGGPNTASILAALMSGGGR